MNAVLSQVLSSIFLVYFRCWRQVLKIWMPLWESRCTSPSIGWGISPVGLERWASYCQHRTRQLCSFYMQRLLVLPIWFISTRLRFERAFCQSRGDGALVRWGHPSKVPRGRFLRFIAARLCALRCWLNRDIHPPWTRTAWACWWIYCDTLITSRKYWPR